MRLSDINQRDSRIYPTSSDKIGGVPGIRDAFRLILKSFINLAHCRLLWNATRRVSETFKTKWLSISCYCGLLNGML